MNDLVDQLLQEWQEQRPELNCAALGVVVRVQLLAKLLGEDAEQALSGLDIKLWEYDVLSALRRQGPPYEMLASELAQASLLTSGTMTTRIDGLEQRGLVERHPNAEDRRTIDVRLTKKGKAVVEEAVAARLARADQQLKTMSATQISQLSDSLRKILLQMTANSSQN